MKLNTQTQYLHRLIAPKGKLFREDRQLIEKIFGTDHEVEVSMDGRVLTWVEKNYNRMGDFTEEDLSELFGKLSIRRIPIRLPRLWLGHGHANCL